MVLTMLCTLSIFAQDKVITVSGKVIEDATKAPVEMAAVQLLSLPDSAQVTGMVTQKQGLFTLPKAKPGKYVLRVSFIGYITQYVPLQLTASAPTKNVGTITLYDDAVMLAEAVVTAEAPPVTVKGDTTEYNASAYRVAEGAMLEDLVKKIPGAEISSDGKVTVNGKEIKKFLVDGKEFFSDDPKVAMKNLPAEMFDKVKAYDKKSDMARITGIDDGEEEAVLDLTVKKGMKQGWIGNLIAGAGSKDRYEALLMASRFKDDSSFSIIGTSNNTNNQGFSEFGDAGQGAGGNTGAGVTSSNSLGMNIAKETKKFQVGGNVQYGYSDNDGRSEVNKENFLRDGTSSYNNSVSTSTRKRHDFRADFRFEWKLDSLTTLIVRPAANYSRTESMSSSLSEELNNDRGVVNTSDKSSSSKSDYYSLSGDVQLFRKLNSRGRFMSVRAQFGYSDTDGDSFSHAYSEYLLKDSTSLVDRYTDRSGDNRNWSVQASYTEPIFKKNYLELRYQFAHRRQVSQSLVYDSISTYPYPEYLERGYSDNLSSRVENYYDTHTINLSVRGNYTKMRYSFGAGITPQSSLSKSPIGPNSGREPIKQHVLNWAPSAMFHYMFSKQHMLMFFYNGRSNAPNPTDLQEVIDVTDPMNLRYGDPNLKPTFSNNFRLRYNKYVPESMRSYMVNLSFNNTINDISNEMTYDIETGARIYKRVNINGNWNARGSFNFNTPLKNRKYTISTNTVGRFSDQVSMQGTEKSTTHNLSAGQSATGNYRSDAFDISLRASIDYGSVRNSTNENTNRETFDYNFGGNTNIRLPWRLEISTDVNCRLKQGYSGGANNNEVIWNAQISKTIFKKSQGTIRLKFYDILGQQTSLSRSISESSMIDTVNNMLGSYVMAHFVYRFNSLGSNAKRNDGNRRGFDGGRRGPGGGGGWGGPGGGGGRPF